MQPIHEANAAGFHRIIRFDKDGKPITGEWVPSSAIATNGPLFASNDGGNVLPVGIFRVVEVAHEVLV